MSLDTTAWTGEGEFTKTLMEVLEGLENIEFVRVEDAPASRADSGYCLISNEVYVRFRTRVRRERGRWLFIPVVRRQHEQVMTLADLEAALTLDERTGPPDYTDDGMLQYLRTERIVAPYQTKGYKLVELVRVYEAPDAQAAGAPHERPSAVRSPRPGTT